MAVKTLQSYAVSVLEHTLSPPALPTAEQRRTMQALADVSAAAFQREVYHSANGSFARFFHTVTPCTALGSMNLGSRPAKRKPSGGIETLRAIPWVFAWTQIRMLIPVWLGGGEALRKMIDEGRLHELRSMYSSWPFFAGLVDLVLIELGKADLGVAARYAEKLCEDPELVEVGASLRRQLDEAILAFLAVAGKRELFEGQPMSKASFSLRSMYLAPLHAIQAEVLRRLRADEKWQLTSREDEKRQLTDALTITVQGIAAGMQNTG